MLKAALAGAFALATIGCLSVSAGKVQLAQAKAEEAVSETTGAVVPTVTEAKIARLKRVLRLSPEQEVHWHPVESMLRKLAQAARRESGGSLVQRVKAKVAGYAAHASAYQQVASVAGPLIASLDERQRQDGMRVIREFGLGQ